MKPSWIQQINNKHQGKCLIFKVQCQAPVLMNNAMNGWIMSNIRNNSATKNPNAMLWQQKRRDRYGKISYWTKSREGLGNLTALKSSSLAHTLKYQASENVCTPKHQRYCWIIWCCCNSLEHNQSVKSVQALQCLPVLGVHVAERPTNTLSSGS